MFIHLPQFTRISENLENMKRPHMHKISANFRICVYKYNIYPGEYTEGGKILNKYLYLGQISGCIIKGSGGNITLFTPPPPVYAYACTYEHT